MYSFSTYSLNCLMILYFSMISVEGRAIVTMSSVSLKHKTQVKCWTKREKYFYWSINIQLYEITICFIEISFVIKNLWRLQEGYICLPRRENSHDSHVLFCPESGSLVATLFTWAEHRTVEILWRTLA